MHMTRESLRKALGDKIGCVLTPEIAMSIEFMAFTQPDRAIHPTHFAERHYHDLTFRAESFREILSELDQLHKLHYAETERHLAGIPMDPDYAGMAARERAGGMVQFVARNAAGELVGNLRMYVMRSTHTGGLFAEEDTFFLMPQYRKGFAALSFLRYVEESLVQQLGVQEIRANTKTVNAASKLMEYRGYQHVANQYVKLFKKEVENVL